MEAVQNSRVDTNAEKNEQLVESSTDTIIQSDKGSTEQTLTDNVELLLVNETDLNENNPAGADSNSGFGWKNV